MDCPKFLYTTADSVKVRLFSKVQFQQGEFPQQGEISNELLAQMIRDAESDVEIALMSRYHTPFQARNGQPFGTLPDHTIRQIRKVVDQRAVILILSTDFGRGTHVGADAYLTNQTELYEKSMETLLGKDRAENAGKNERPRMSRPLDGLRLAHGNRADTGFFGKLINTDGSRDAATYAEEQINDPSRTYIQRHRGGGGSGGVIP